jgi:SCP-2 sterol transfer family
MPVFETKDELHRCFGSLFKAVIARIMEENNLKTTEISVRFTLSDPATSFSVIADRERQIIFYDDEGWKPDMEFWLTSDMAHRMLMGKVNLTDAITKGLIRAKGPFFKILKILPYLRVSKEIYPAHYQGFITHN